MINSLKNPQVKYLKKLNIQKSFREKEKKFLVEGKNLVKEALRDLKKEELEKAIISFELLGSEETKYFVLQFQQRNIPFLEVTSQVFKKISSTENPQGVAVLCKQKEIFWDEQPIYESLILILENLQDPGNLGTILRTAESAGVELVFLSEDSVDLYNPKVVRASAGSIFRVNIKKGDIIKFIKNLKNKNFKILATSSKNGVFYDKITYKLPLALVLGQESTGISGKILKLADEIVTIPLSGKVESLNVATACAVLLFGIKTFLQRI